MRYFFLFFAFALCHSSISQTTTDDRLLRLVEDELQREVSEFAKAKEPPYYISYRIRDHWSGGVSSSFGSLIESGTNRSRILATDVRIGDYAFDNSHMPDSEDEIDFPAEILRGGSRPRSAALPLDDSPEAIHLVMWAQTQGVYRSALESYKTLRSSKNNQPTQRSDFAKASAQVYIDEPLMDFTTFYDHNSWQERVKKYTAPFLPIADIVSANATLDIGQERKYFLSTEGTRLAQNRTYAHLMITASIRADDGNIISLHRSYFGFTPQELPDDSAIQQDVEKLIGQLKLLKNAPVAEPYTGPAILYSSAAGVFFHEIFGHRIEGHRLVDKRDGQTFKEKVGQQVLPKSFNVVDDPTLRYYNGKALNGYYPFDDEGVKAQRVDVVSGGILKSFLMSRKPLDNFSQSNGHGRAEGWASPVSRQANLIIENKKVVPMNDLRKMLISECKKQKKAYGYLFMEVTGGFTTTQRFMPNAFNIFPTEVYRIYVDGRPDELVRGVDLIGTPLSMFAEIVAADDKCEVFTGFCGAESGSVPVTAISPSLFVKRIETQKKSTEQVDKPLLKKPYADQDN